MSAHISLPERIETYLAERRRLGFELQHMGQALARFARYVEAVGHHGPLTVEVMAAWARQVKGGRGDRGTAARALRLFRPFTRWLQQFEPATEVPDEATFGPVPGRVTPHIFRDEESDSASRWAIGSNVGASKSPMSRRFSTRTTAGATVALAAQARQKPARVQIEGRYSSRCSSLDRRFHD